MLGRACSALALTGALLGTVLLVLVMLICVAPFVLLFCSLNELKADTIWDILEEGPGD